MMKRKKNPQDLTTRNARASVKRDKRLRKRIGHMEARLLKAIRRLTAAVQAGKRRG